MSFFRTGTISTHSTGISAGIWLISLEEEDLGLSTRSIDPIEIEEFGEGCCWGMRRVV